MEHHHFSWVNQLFQWHIYGINHLFSLVNDGTSPFSWVNQLFQWQFTIANCYKLPECTVGNHGNTGSQATSYDFGFVHTSDMLDTSMR